VTMRVSTKVGTGTNAASMWPAAAAAAASCRLG